MSSSNATGTASTAAGGSSDASARPSAVLSPNRHDSRRPTTTRSRGSCDSRTSCGLGDVARGLPRAVETRSDDAVRRRRAAFLAWVAPTARCCRVSNGTACPRGSTVNTPPPRFWRRCSLRRGSATRHAGALITAVLERARDEGDESRCCSRTSARSSTAGSASTPPRDRVPRQVGPRRAQRFSRDTPRADDGRGPRRRPACSRCLDPGRMPAVGRTRCRDLGASTASLALLLRTMGRADARMRCRVARRGGRFFGYVIGVEVPGAWEVREVGAATAPPRDARKRCRRRLPRLESPLAGRPRLARSDLVDALQAGAPFTVRGHVPSRWSRCSTPVSTRRC